LPQEFLFLSYYVRNSDLKKASANPQSSENNHTPPGSSALTVLPGMAPATALWLNAALQNRPLKIPTASYGAWWAFQVIHPTLPGQEDK